MIIHKNLHFNFHEIYRWFSFIFPALKHLITCEQEYGWNWRGFILCEESCGYCRDLGYEDMKCKRCFENGKWIRWP